MKVRARDLQPGDLIAATREIVGKVTKSKMTPIGKVDVWLDRRHAEWKASRLIEIERQE